MSPEPRVAAWLPRQWPRGPWAAAPLQPWPQDPGRHGGDPGPGTARALLCAAQDGREVRGGARRTRSLLAPPQRRAIVETWVAPPGCRPHRPSRRSLVRRGLRQGFDGGGREREKPAKPDLGVIHNGGKKKNLRKREAEGRSLGIPPAPSPGTHGTDPVRPGLPHAGRRGKPGASLASPRSPPRWGTAARRGVCSAGAQGARQRAGSARGAVSGQG